MGILGNILHRKHKEYIDIIEWVDSTSNKLIWRFPRYKGVIKNGAQLTVCKSQVAVLVSEGKIVDVYQPGTYKLTRVNMPILATFKRWKYDFNLPFKVDIYFVNTKQFWNIRWKTINPIVMNESDFKNISMHASGLYCFQVKLNSIKFIQHMVETDRSFTPESVTAKMQDFVIGKFTDYLTISKITILDLASNLDEFSCEFTLALKNDFLDYGLELMKFSVKEIEVSENVKNAIKKRAKLDSRSLKSISSNSTHKINLPHNNKNTDIGLNKSIEMAQMMVVFKNEISRYPEDGTQNCPNFRKKVHSPITNELMYHIAIGGIQQGPFRQSQLQKMIEHGHITPYTLVWTMGMNGWETAKSIPSLLQLFRADSPTL